MTDENDVTVHFKQVLNRFFFYFWIFRNKLILGEVLFNFVFPECGIKNRKNCVYDKIKWSILVSKKTLKYLWNTIILL